MGVLGLVRSICATWLQDRTCPDVAFSCTDTSFSFFHDRDIPVSTSHMGDQSLPQLRHFFES